MDIAGKKPISNTIESWRKVASYSRHLMAAKVGYRANVGRTLIWGFRAQEGRFPWDSELYEPRNGKHKCKVQLNRIYCLLNKSTDSGQTDYFVVMQSLPAKMWAYCMGVCMIGWQAEEAAVDGQKKERKVMGAQTTARIQCIMYILGETYRVISNNIIK